VKSEEKDAKQKENLSTFQPFSLPAFQPRAIIFYIIFFLFVLTFSSMTDNYDYDFWARLIAGMSVVQTGHVLRQDFLSYTPTHPWFDHEWGSGVIFYLTQHFFSSAGILILQALLVFLIFFVITKIVELRGVKTTSAYNFLFYYLAFSAMSDILNLPVRCQLFSFLFFALFLYILELARKGENRPLFALPFLMIVWNNLHGGCVSGIGLIVIYIVGELLNRKPVKKYIYALIPTIFVLPVNPWGIEYLRFLWKATTMPRPEIMEWWGLFSKQNISGYMKFKVLASILVLTELGVVIKQLISKTFSFDKTKFLVLVITLFLAIQHTKLVPFFVISAVCFLYDDFYTAFNALTRNIFNRRANFKDTLIYLIFIIFVATNLNAKSFGPMLNFYKYPVKSVEFIKINGLKGNLLTNFGMGSYASYKLYPNNKIFMDGRYEEVYYDFMMPMLKSFFLVTSDWDELLKRFPPDVMIVEKFYPIYDTLKTGKVWKPILNKKNVMVSKNTNSIHHYNWKLVFEEKYFGVFVRAKDVKKIYQKPSSNLDYYKNTLFDTDINFKN